MAPAIDIVSWINSEKFTNFFGFEILLAEETWEVLLSAALDALWTAFEKAV